MMRATKYIEATSGPQQNGTTSQEKSPTKKAAQRFQRNTHPRLVMLLLCSRASAMALTPASPMSLPPTLEVESKIGRHVSRSANDARHKTQRRHRPTAKRHNVTGKIATKKAAQHFQRNTHLRLVMLLLCLRASAMALAPASPMLLLKRLEVGSMSGKK